MTDYEASTRYWRLIESITGDHTGDVVRWLDRQRGWRLENSQGNRVYLKSLDLKAMSDEDRTNLAQTISDLYRTAPDRPVPRESAPDARQEPEPRPVPETPNPQAAPKPPKPQALPKPRQEPKPQEPRREVDDETLTREVLEFLKDNRLSEYTYNQIADEPSIWCDFKPASRVLRRLRERAPDVIEYKHPSKKDKKGDPVKLWKFAPERKLLDADYSRAPELVGSGILSFLAAKGPQSQNAICSAMKRYFGYIDKAVVKQVLEGLQATGSVEETPGPRGAKVFAEAVSG